MKRTKKKTKKPTSRASSLGPQIIESLQELVEGLQRGEPIEKLATVRQVSLQLPPVPAAAEVKDARKQLRMSQPLFALFLGVSVQTVRAWEQGINVPCGLACRLVHEIRHEPAYWERRFRESLVRTVVGGPPTATAVDKEKAPSDANGIVGPGRQAKRKQS